MSIGIRAALLVAASIALCASGYAQAAEPHVPLQKTIGQGKTQVVPSILA